MRHETIAFILGRDDDGLDKGVVERWSDSGRVLKAESTGLASRLYRERRKGIKEDYNILGLNTLSVSSADIFGDGENENWPI